MIKLGTYFTIAFIVWNLCVSQGHSWDGELSRSPRKVPPNQFLIAMFPLLDNIAQQCKSNVSDVVTETQTMVVTIKDQLTGLQRDNKENLSEVKAQLMESFSNSIPKNFEERLAKIEEQQIQESLKRSEDFQKILERIEAFQKDVQSKMDYQKAALTNAFTGVGRKLLIEKFERIGSRLFHISETPGDWNEAVETCRGLDGYIASIKDQAELTALAARLDDKHYWLGINDLVSKGTYVSEASGKKPVFLKWRSGEPNNEYGDERCVELLNGGMNDVPCSQSNLYPICQANNEI